MRMRNRFKEGWRRAGGEEENYLDMRSPDVNHNFNNLKFLNLPIGFSADDFNAFNFSTPVSHVVSYGVTGVEHVAFFSSVTLLLLFADSTGGAPARILVCM